MPEPTIVIDIAGDWLSRAAFSSVDRAPVIHVPSAFKSPLVWLMTLTLTAESLYLKAFL